MAKGLAQPDRNGRLEPWHRYLCSAAFLVPPPSVQPSQIMQVPALELENAMTLIASVLPRHTFLDARDNLSVRQSSWSMHAVPQEEVPFIRPWWLVCFCNLSELCCCTATFYLCEQGFEAFQRSCPDALTSCAGALLAILAR
jgi:hypothetical protein